MGNPKNSRARIGDRPDVATRFKPGNVANPRGRPKGVPNKATTEAKEACALIVDDPEYREMLKQRAILGKLAPGVETMLWDRAKGKVKDHVELTGADGAPLIREVIVRFLDPHNTPNDEGEK